MGNATINRLRKNKKGKTWSKFYAFGFENVEGEMPLMYSGVDIKQATKY